MLTLCWHGPLSLLQKLTQKGLTTSRSSRRLNLTWATPIAAPQLLRVQERYAEDFEHAVVETYVLSVACGPDADLRPFIHAIKYPPKKPATFALAALHDIYKEVYVEDRSGRIRLYEDVQGQAMLTLSERFKPACLPI